MKFFIGFKYEFSEFLDDFLLKTTSTKSRNNCFDLLSGDPGYWIDPEDYDLKPRAQDKVRLSRRISGESRWQIDEYNMIVENAYAELFEKLKIVNSDVTRINLFKLQKIFENGLPKPNSIPRERDTEYQFAHKVNEILNIIVVGAQQDNPIACKKLYAFALYTVLCYYVSNGKEVVNVPDEIKELIDNSVNKTDAIKKSDFANIVLAISSATYPDKTGSNTADKPVLFTRYALFALIKKEFPEEEALLKLLGRDNTSVDELTKACKTVEINSDELKTLFTYIDFISHYNTYNGKKKPTGMILVNINGNREDKTSEQYRKAMDALVSAYQALPKEFHENVKSKLKRELNFTISELVLSVAYKGIFSRSEYDRANLLEICDGLVKTHNHNNKYLYSLIEKSREDTHLFKEYTKEDHECERVIQIFYDFFYDNWKTEQSASYIGAKFLIWCNDAGVIFNLIDGYCYDPRIWLEFASKYKGANALREIVQNKLFKNCNLREHDCINHIISFLQMGTTQNFKFLIFNVHDEQYNTASKTFIKYLIENISYFPKDKLKLVNQGLVWMLNVCNGYDPDCQRSVAKQLLEEVNIDWDLDIYSQLKAYKAKIYDNKSGSTEYPAVVAFLEDMIALNRDITNVTLMQKASVELKSLLLDSRVVFDEDVTEASQKLIEILLNQKNEYVTIFATADRLSCFSEKTVIEVFEYTKNFLLNCDYAHQENTNISRALRILEYKCYIGTEDALYRCYTKLSEIKDCKAIDLLIYLLKGLSINRIISLLQDEKKHDTPVFSQATEWLLKDNRHQLAEHLNSNIIFEFVDSLIDARNADQINHSLATSVLHFSKKQDCFADKVPSSDEFYSEILLESNEMEINSKWLKNKAKKYNLSYNTALFHLCKILKKEPHRTAYICIEGLSKFYGNTEYLYFNPNKNDIKNTLLFQRRKELFSLLISNPAIRNTAKFYCWNLRRYNRVLPISITELILDVLNNDKYPDWLCDVEVEELDIVAREDVWASKLKYEYSNRLANDNLVREIQEKFIPFLQFSEFSNDPQKAYTTNSLVVAINSGGFYHIVDGSRTISKLLEESKMFGDFKINIVVINL